MSKLGGNKKQIARTTPFKFYASLPGLNIYFSFGLPSLNSIE